MERLTDKIRNFDGTASAKQSLINDGLPSDYCSKILTKLAEYEDAEEQGLLLRLPYPFGTKLYYVIDDWDYGMSVNEVIFDLEFVSDVLRYPDEYYLTREEAEQALAEMQKGD